MQVNCTSSSNWTDGNLERRAPFTAGGNDWYNASLEFAGIEPDLDTWTHNLDNCQQNPTFKLVFEILDTFLFDLLKWKHQCNKNILTPELWAQSNIEHSTHESVNLSDDIGIVQSKSSWSQCLMTVQRSLHRIISIYSSIIA